VLARTPEETRQAILDTMKRATRFMTDEAAVGGGMVQADGAGIAGALSAGSAVDAAAAEEG